MSELFLDDLPIVLEPEPRPHNRLGPKAWARANLFDSKTNSVITVIVGLIGGYLTWKALAWLISIDFTIIRDTLRIFIIGQFPDDELWRLWAAGMVLMTAIGLIAGSSARNANDLALSQGLTPDRTGPLQLLRRFWAILAVLILFASFARTIQPMVGVLAAIALVFIVRQLAWAAPAAIRNRAVYGTALLVVASMLVVAGTSRLGGFCIGLVMFVWALNEMSHRDLSGASGKVLRWVIPLAIAIVFGVVVASIGFEGFGWKQWGGIHVNLFTAVVGIALGMPLGILLALGRQSKLPVVRTASVLYIEFVRGVPLISLLLFSKLLLPLFLPIDMERPTALTLAIIVIMGFSAAYIAEIVRGGLQAVAKGQTEAAQALGLSPGAMQRLIVLPQALRAVIPAMVGQFIALFKDTTLLTTVAVLEFLDAASIANNQPQFLGKGLAPVTYLFVAVGFWAFAFTMSKESRRLERRLGVGTR